MRSRARGPVRGSVRVRTRLVGAPLVAGALLLAGCAGIPTSGPIQHGAAVGDPRTEPATRSLAQPPREGASQLQIIEGFLNANESFDDDHAVARLFLTPDAAKTWNPAAGTTVYDNSTSTGGDSYKPVGTSEIVFSAAKVGTISQQGQYDVSGGTVEASFKLKQVDGQWRIVSLPQGLLISAGAMGRDYSDYDVYFPDPNRSVLVPDQVLLPISPGTSTALVRALIAGPTPWLAPAVRTAIPTGTKLVVDSAPIVDGVVEVDLTAPAATAIGKEAQALSAQIVWTLRPLSGVTAVRITVDGIALRGVPAVQPITSWPQWDPDADPAAGVAGPVAYFANGERLFSLHDDKAVAVPGQVGDGTFALHHPGVSFDESEVAGLDPGQHSLYVTKVGAGVKVAGPVLTEGTRLTAPSWDRFGMVWTADARATGNVVWVDAPGAAPKKVATQGLPSGRILALRISRDGARVAIIVQSPGESGTSSIYLGRVERPDGPPVLLSGFRPVDTVFTTVADVAWKSADLLLALGQVTTGGPLQPLYVDLFGASVRALGPIVSSAAASPGIVSITAAPGQAEVLASTSDGRLFRYLDVGWVELGKGQYPSYPG